MGTRRVAVARAEREALVRIPARREPRALARASVVMPEEVGAVQPRPVARVGQVELRVEEEEEEAQDQRQAERVEQEEEEK